MQVQPARDCNVSERLELLELISCGGMTQVAYLRHQIGRKERMTEEAQEQGREQEQEEWRPVVGYEGWYEVSNRGNIKRVAKGKGARPGVILKGDIRYDKCKVVVLLTGSAASKKTQYVHRIVAAAFLGPIPPGYTINHKDFDRTNNCVANLEIITAGENKLHAFLGGRIPKGDNHWNAILTERDIPTIRDLLTHQSCAKIARLYGVTSGAIRDIRDRRNWSHIK